MDAKLAITYFVIAGLLTVLYANNGDPARIKQAIAGLMTMQVGAVED